jgi:hypothetical protein
MLENKALRSKRYLGDSVYAEMQDGGIVEGAKS